MERLPSLRLPTPKTKDEVRRLIEGRLGFFRILKEFWHEPPIEGLYSDEFIIPARPLSTRPTTKAYIIRAPSIDHAIETIAYIVTRHPDPMAIFEFRVFVPDFMPDIEVINTLYGIHEEMW